MKGEFETCSIVTVRSDFPSLSTSFLSSRVFSNWYILYFSTPGASEREEEHETVQTSKKRVEEARGNVNSPTTSNAL